MKVLSDIKGKISVADSWGQMSKVNLVLWKGCLVQFDNMTFT